MFNHQLHLILLILILSTTSSCYTRFVQYPAGGHCIDTTYTGNPGDGGGDADPEAQGIAGCRTRAPISKE